MTMIALVRGVTSSFALSRSMARVSSVQSQKTMSAPTQLIAWKSAEQLNEETITSSPGPTPATSKAMCNPAVPVLSAATWRSGAPMMSLTLASKDET